MQYKVLSRGVMWSALCSKKIVSRTVCMEERLGWEASWEALREWEEEGLGGGQTEEREH